MHREDFLQAIVFLQQTLKKAGFKKLIVGVSGGVDSAVSASLAVAALRAENVLVALLPYGNLHPAGLKNASLLLKKLKIPAKNIFKIDIQPAVSKFLKHDPLMNNLRKGNIIARVRMIFLFDLAKKHKALVCGTENKSERLLGYFTRFGDEASDLEPLRNLYKTKVYKLAKYLQIPKSIIQTPPTAGLWRGQTDEKELGFSYKKADPIIYLLYEKKLTGKKIVKMGYPKDLVEKIRKRFKENEFKHHIFI